MRVCKAKYGAEYVKLTKEETEIIAKTAVDLLLVPDDNLARFHGTNALVALVDQHDTQRPYIDALIRCCERVGIAVDPKLKFPSTAREQYQGLEHWQAHKVRRFRAAQIIRKAASEKKFDLRSRADEVFEALSEFPTGPSAELIELIDTMKRLNLEKVRKQRAQRKEDEAAVRARLDREKVQMDRRVKVEIQNVQLVRANARLNAEKVALMESEKGIEADKQEVMQEASAMLSRAEEHAMELREQMARVIESNNALNAELAMVRRTNAVEINRMMDEIAELKAKLKAKAREPVVAQPSPLLDRMQNLRSSNVIPFPGRTYQFKRVEWFQALEDTAA